MSFTDALNIVEGNTPHQGKILSATKSGSAISYSSQQYGLNGERMFKVAEEI